MDWLTADIQALAVTATAIGFLHTVLGPDHYVPFVALARARRWSASRTVAVTLACGVGHAAGSVAIGMIGITIGVGLNSMVDLEALRLDLAAWLLLGLGLAYMAWALRRLHTGKPHRHAHVHADGTIHDHEHDHASDHAHVHAEGARVSLAPWALFVVFVLGPCEALIPMLMVPASQQNTPGVVLVTTLFVITTLATMVSMVMLGLWGVSRLRLPGLERYVEVVAGGAIAVCGAAVLIGL
ncbi:MAG: hypothetical protein QNJ40_07105 [Xanthomonadales bacterium]|nr:hypothetical protein [Xanthomonadales bacterium]